MDIALDYYRIFEAVARHRSFTRAAEALVNSQPNLTRAVHNLEAELGCRLFLRSSRGVERTPEGEALYAHVTAAMEQLRAGEAELQRQRELRSGMVSIACSETALHAVLLQVLSRFHRENPAIRLRVSNQSAPEAIAYLSVVAQAIRQSFPALCLGVLVNWDGVAALAVADAAGADFVRVEHLYTGAEVTSAGLLQGQCCEITALKRKLGTDIPVYADVWERHGIPLCPQPLDEAAWQCVHEAFADGLFLCGKNAQESLSMARQVRQRVPGVPLFLGGGATGDNVRELLQEYDAVCVATWIKNGDMRNPVDPDRTRYFMEQAALAEVGT